MPLSMHLCFEIGLIRFLKDSKIEPWDVHLRMTHAACKGGMNMKILIAVLMLICTAAVIACCRMAGECSRMEERRGEGEKN